MKDETKVSIVAAVCVMALAVVFKNVLHIPPDQSFIPMISPAILFVVYACSKKKNAECRYNANNIWIATILLVTLAIILVYALWP